MDLTKSNFLEDRFKLSSFSLRIYEVNAGNLIIRFGTCLNRALEKRTISYLSVSARISVIDKTRLQNDIGRCRLRESY